MGIWTGSTYKVRSAPQPFQTLEHASRRSCAHAACGRVPRALRRGHILSLAEVRKRLLTFVRNLLVRFACCRRWLTSGTGALWATL